MPFRLLAILIACAALAACATKSGPSVPASEVQVYNSTQLTPTQYSVVDHIWIDTGKSAFGYPSFGNFDAAVQAMKEQAGQAGATGLLNIMCMDGKGWNNGQQLCYGDAIKFKSVAAEPMDRH
jgi:hypothetical protein